jgi:hypothetical protein
MSISTYFRPNIHQNGPEILGVNIFIPSPISTIFEFFVRIIDFIPKSLDFFMRIPKNIKILLGIEKLEFVLIIVLQQF